MLIYRCLITLLALPLLFKAWREGALQARTGRIPPLDNAPHVWLHAASNGELASVRVAVSSMLRAGHRVLITCNTASGVDLARSWNLDGVESHLAPLDLRAANARVFRNWNVRHLILVESELWPNRITQCPGQVCVLGARMSARTARVWQRFPHLCKRVFPRLGFVSAQDPGSRARLTDLGVPHARFGPDTNLKAAYQPDLSGTAPHFGPGPVWLAASTHPGEDEILARAHQHARIALPDLRMILAPRHPARADDIEQLLSSMSLSVSRRSRSESPDGAAVYLADTLGEMAHWYQAANVVFVAGSLTDRGGHTPFEPAYFARPILHGPDVANFEAAYAALHVKGAAITAATPEEIAKAIETALQNAGSLGQTAQRVLADGDQTTKTVKKLLEYLGYV